MRIALEPQLGRNVEAYIDDLVMKTVNRATLLDDLEETFHNLWCMHMKLNPEKCVFAVLSNKLLSFLISSRGIEANPKKITAINRMRRMCSV